MCAFLIVPVVLSVLAGLSENFFIGVKSGLTLRWVAEVWDALPRTRSSVDEASRSPASPSTLVLGVPIAYVLARAANRWTRLFEELLVLPVAVPGLATALALILFYGEWRAFRASWTFILVGHVLFTLPFMVRSVRRGACPRSTSDARGRCREPRRGIPAAILRRHPARTPRRASSPAR